MNKFLHTCGADCRNVRPAKAYEKALIPKLHRYRSGAGRGAITLVAEVCDTQLITQWKLPLPNVCKAMGFTNDEVIALSRMVKVGGYKTSKLLRLLLPHMKQLGYKAVVTYSDDSLGHTGNVYKLSGFKQTEQRRSPYYVDSAGARTSISVNGKKNPGAFFAGWRTLTRWERLL